MIAKMSAHSAKSLVASCLVLIVCLDIVLAISNPFETLKASDAEENASKARNLRHECRVHYKKANDAQIKMFEAENKDNTVLYEYWLAKMRKYDEKLNQCSEEYEELRDYLESKIWSRELMLEGFEKRYAKDTWSSILDHLTFRAST